MPKSPRIVECVIEREIGWANHAGSPYYGATWKTSDGGEFFIWFAMDKDTWSGIKLYNATKRNPGHFYDQVRKREAEKDRFSKRGRQPGNISAASQRGQRLILQFANYIKRNPQLIQEYQARKANKEAQEAIEQQTKERRVNAAMAGENSLNVLKRVWDWLGYLTREACLDAINHPNTSEQIAGQLALDVFNAIKLAEKGPDDRPGIDTPEPGEFDTAGQNRVGA